MMYLLTFENGEQYLVSLDSFADLDDLHHYLTMGSDEIVSIQRFFPIKVNKK